MKKNGIKKLLFCIVLLSFMHQVNAQLAIDGQFRTKFAYRDGYETLLPTGANPVYIAIQRTRLNFKYNHDKLRALFSIEDVRVWGDSKYKTDVPTMTVYEAWGEILFNDVLSLKIGRQELRYDNDRLLGSRNWNDVGASHDLALLKYSKNDFRAHFGFAVNNDESRTSRAYYTLDYYKALGFIWLSKKFSNGFKLTAIALGDGYQKENSVDTIFVRYTYGGNVYYENKESKLDFHGIAYYQSGEDNVGNNINAYFLSSKLTYKITKNFSLIGAIDYFSGNDALSDSETRTSFNKLYGNGHGYYGYMDYFTDVEKHTKGGGLMDIYGGLKYDFNSGSNIELMYHNFSFTNNVIDPESDLANPTTADKLLGSEIDMLFNYKYSKGIAFKFGYSMMFATKSMEILKAGSSDRFANWAWIMVTLKPVFYKQKKENSKN